VHEYETVFILDPGLDENQVNEEVEKTTAVITSHGGKINDLQRWGRKRLAYEINKKRDGVYTLIKHESSGETVKELERRLRLNDNVMRVMTVIAGPTNLVWSGQNRVSPGAIFKISNHVLARRQTCLL